MEQSWSMDIDNLAPGIAEVFFNVFFSVLLHMQAASYRPMAFSPGLSGVFCWHKERMKREFSVSQNLVRMGLTRKGCRSSGSLKSGTSMKEEIGGKKVQCVNVWVIYIFVTAGVTGSKPETVAWSNVNVLGSSSSDNTILETWHWCR